MYYGLATSILYVFAMIGMFISMLIIHRLISDEKKRDRKAMRGEPNLRRFGKFQGKILELIVVSRTILMLQILGIICFF